MPVGIVGPLNSSGGGAIASNASSNSGNPRKRQRTLVSCTECHRRKQKCDRQWPCGNCTSRSASHLCQYERKARKDESSIRKGANARTDSQHTDDSGGDLENDSDGDFESMMITTRNNASEFGYTMGVQNTSLNVLEKLDIGCDNKLHPVYSDRTLRFSNPNDLNTYNNLVRLIPARPFTNLLVQVFFTEVNFLYGALHQPTFNRMLDEWWNIATVSPCGTLGGIPHPGGKSSGCDPYLTNDIHFFPSLLLQVLSSSIQLLPREHHEYISQIKLGICETLQDFSARLSNASCELAVLLGGTCTASLNRVLQAFLRGSWLKNEGRIHEAWHSLGTAIRSAQEQGFHLESGSRGAGAPGMLLRGFGGDIRSAGSYGMGEQLRMMWYRELENRVWINLYIWDRYMSMLLGRPTMINDRYCTVTMPLDCEPPADLTSRKPTPRGVMDPPSSFTQRILEYRIAHLVNEVEEITQAFNTTSTPDFIRLDALHAKLMGFTESFPPEFSITTRNTSYDSGLPFLAVQATLLKSAFYSVIVALHRPYLFLREKSRKEIVRSALIILECQDMLVKLLKEHHHRLYAICFFTFDPCVLLSAVVITNCSTMDKETLGKSLVSLRAGWKRLRMLGVYVTLAEKGSVVLRLLLRKIEVLVEGLRWENSPEEAINESTVGASESGVATFGRNKSPRERNGGEGVRNGKSSQSSKSNTPENPSSSSVSPPTGQTSEHSSTNSSPSELDLATSQLSPTIPTSNYFDFLNTTPTYGGRHNQQQHGHQQSATPLEWDDVVLIDIPATHTDISHISVITEPIIPVTISATHFDFTNPASHTANRGGFPSFFDGVSAFPMSNTTGLHPQNGENNEMNGNQRTQGEDWEVPHGDGLWQNLLGIFGTEA